MVEHELRRSLLRNKFQSYIFDLVDRQKFLHYHTEMLVRGDRQTRRDFRFLQRWYTQILDLPLERVREYMRLVDVDDLEGFAVPPITRPFGPEDECEDEDDEPETPSDSDEPGGGGGLSVAEEMMASMGFATIEELDACLRETTTAGEGGKTSGAESYDDDGFYIGDDNEDDNDDAPDECGRDGYETDNDDDDEEDEDELLLATSPPTSSTSSQYSDYQHYDPTLRLARARPRRAPPPPPLSGALVGLLKILGVDTTTTASGGAPRRPLAGPAALTAREFEDAARDWADALGAAKRREARRYRAVCEPWAEAAVLDGWDDVHARFHWQSEGLFLARLAELLYKDRFERARAVFWIEVQHPPRRSGGGASSRRAAERSGSPLRRQYFP